MRKDSKVKMLLTGVILGAVITATAFAGILKLGGCNILTAEAAREYADFKKTYGFAESLRQLVKEEYYLPQTEDQALIDGMYKGIVMGLGDPYSQYLTEKELKELVEQLNGSYCGIGVVMSPSDDDYIEVISVTDESPAEKAGIRTGDLILGVDGLTYSGSQLAEAAETIRGEKGTKVRLTVLREKTIRSYELVRQELSQTTVYSEMKEGNIGYLRISSFEVNTGKDFSAALKKMEDNGAEGLIIDLRNNGGGVVDSAIQVADELMDEATVIYAENQKGERTYYRTKDGRTRLPYVLLVDGGTASAAEILAAGVSEYGGLVVGSKTYGKGVIQTTQQLVNGGALKLTTMQYYTPSGKKIHKQGMTPGIEVKLTAEDVDENGVLVDRQLKRAMELFEKAK